MRIAVVSTPFLAVPPVTYGGTELVVHALCRALERARHEVTLFATGDSRATRLRALFATPIWPPDPYAELLHCRFAARAIAAGSFDVVHAHVTAMLAFADDLDAPLVYTVHNPIGRSLAWLQEAAPRARLVAISARQAQTLARPPDAVVHHGLDPRIYPAYGSGGDAAFFIDRLSWVKAPDVAIEAARRAGLSITVAGREHPGDEAPDGWREQVLEPALAAPHVSLLASADVETKRRLFARSRAVLVPLRWEEPFGLVMIEALLAGCPVIAFARGAAPEIVEHGRNGFLVDDVAGMADGLTRAAGLNRAAIQARARVRFSAERMAAEYVAVYAAAIAEHRAPAPAGPPVEGPWTTLAR